MATGNFQTPSQIRFYPSYPLWARDKQNQYSNHAPPFGEESYFDLDPSRIKRLPEADESPGLYLEWNLRHRIHTGDPSFATSFNDDGTYNTPSLSFDYFMVLGHDFSSKQLKVTPHSEMWDSDTETYESTLLTGSYNDSVNPMWTIAPQYNGWSFTKFATNQQFGNEIFPNPTYNVREKYINFQFTNTSPYSGSIDPGDFYMGTILFGKSWTTPVNCDLDVDIDYEYGTKTITTLGGKELTAVNWSRPNSWMQPAWQLTDRGAPLKSNAFTEISRSGRRVWSVSFSMMDNSKVMSQNMMINNFAYTTHDDYSSTDYDIQNGNDFYTNVINPTKGGNLPLVIQLSADDDTMSNSDVNTDQFAIVKIKNLKISQTGHKFSSVSMVLEEQL